MPVFQYKALTGDGVTSFGTLDAPSKDSVIEILTGRGETPIEVKAKTAGFWQRLNEPVEFAKKISRNDILRFTQEMGRLLKAGILVERALMILIDTGEGKAMRELLSRLQETVRDGGSLSEAMVQEKKHFPLFYIQVIRAGELSGALEEAFVRLGSLLERQHRFKSALLSALIYPSILMVLVAITMIIVVGFVLPEFETVFAGNAAELPFVTKMVMGFGRIVSGYWALGILLFLALGFFARYWLKKPDNRLVFDGKILKVKIIGSLLVKSQVALIFRNLGSMIENGVPLSDAFPLVLGTIKNRAIERDFRSAFEGIKEGGALSSLFSRASYFPKTAIQLVRVGEETGNLGAMIEEAATLLEHDVETAMKRFLALFSPILTLIMGGLIAAIIGAVLLGILSINEMAF